MNNKQTVLKHMESYRDKELSFGCEVVMRSETWTFLHQEGRDILFRFKDTQASEWFKKPNIEEIIGHPLTHADLLLAMEKKDAGLICVLRGGFLKVDHELKIPLNYRTIEDIPEDDIMWEYLLKAFGLVDK